MTPGVPLEDIWKAVSGAYTKKTLDRMLLFGLNRVLGDEVADGTVPDMVFDLLTKSKREGWTVDLVEYAFKYNPKNSDLLRVYEKYHLAPSVNVQHSGTVDSEVISMAGGGFEKSIKFRLPAFDFAVWREKMALACFAVSSFVFCFRRPVTLRGVRLCGRAGAWCARSPQDFAQIVGQFWRRLQSAFEPARQVGDAVGARQAQPVGQLP
jgi:hypothetical protein